MWLHSTSSTHHRYRHSHVHRRWPHPADTCGYTLQALLTTGTDTPVFTDIGLTLRTRVATLYKLYSPQVQTPPCKQALASPCGHVWVHSTSSTHHRYSHPSIHKHWPHPADTCGYTLQALLTTGRLPRVHRPWPPPRTCVATLYKLYSPQVQTPRVHRHWPHPADTFGYTLQALLTTGTDTPRVHRHWPHLVDTCSYTLQALLTTDTDTPVFTGLGLTLRTRVATLYKLYSPQVQTPVCSQALASPCRHVWLHSTHHRYRLPVFTGLGLTMRTRVATLYSTSSTHHRYRHPVFTGLGLTLRTRVATPYTLYSPQVETPPCSQALALPCGLVCLHSTSSTHHRYRFPRVHRPWPHPADTCGYR